MRRSVYLIGFYIWMAVQIPSAHADGGTDQDQYLYIYVKMHDAETLEAQGDYAGALAGFKDCYDRLAKLHKKDPDWETALVVHRMEDCRVTIEKLQNQVGSQTPTPPPAPPTPPPVVPPTPSAGGTNTPPTTSTDTNMPSDVEGLKKKLQAVELELQVTKESLKNSQLEVDAYRGQLQTVNAQLQGFKNKSTVDDKVGRLLTENKALTEKLVAAQKQIDDLKAPNPKSKVALMQTQLKNLQDQFDESQEANKALQQTITTLQQKLNQAQSDLSDANQKLAAGGSAASPEYTTIKRENEVMRAILTREIQEQAHRDMAKRLYQEEFDNLKIKSKVLQEQLDILASPMTPATSDEERALLASLKVPTPDVTQPPINPGNTLSAPASPTTTATPDASANPAPAPSSPDTNTVATPNTPAAPAPDTNTATATPPPSTPAPDASNTPATSTAPAPDTNTAAATPSTPPATPSTDTPSTSPATAPDTNTAAATPPTPPPSAPSTDTPTVTPTTPPSAPDQTASQTPPPNNQPDPTEIARKPSLPDDMRDTAQEAADFFKMKRYDEAAAKYQSIIDKYPESLYAWSNLGVVRYQQGDLNDALKALQQAVKLSPQDAFSYSNLGIVYYEMKQYENAIDALNAAKALDPNDAKTRNYLGCAESQKGWQEAAEKEFLKAIELDPSFGDAHFNLALVYATEKPPLLELARKEYHKALDLGIAKDDRLEKLLQMPSQSQASQP